VFPPDTADGDGPDLPTPLLLEKRRIVSGESVLTFHVTDPPGRVGIDPYNKMIDRNPEDNLKRL
jgi:hypothetical protein